MIRVLYFAGLRDVTGKPEELIDADDCLFGGAISARESRESFDIVSHELRWNSFQSFQQFNRFAPFKS